MQERSSFSYHEDMPVSVSPPSESTGRLPRPLTTLIGRDDDVVAILRMLARDDSRLLTLIGPGGIGKTRLSIRIAETADMFPGGIWFVPLATVTDPELVFPAIVAATGAIRNDSQSELENLATHLRDSRTLIVLDNFEQVVDAGSILASMIAACPALTLLVTSRTRLNLTFERVYAVPPLELVPALNRANLAELSHSAAIRLFVERARDRLPQFTLTEQNAPVVAAICHRLDGLPLGIELAAARLTALSPKEILDRLDERLGLLADGARD